MANEERPLLVCGVAEGKAVAGSDTCGRTAGSGMRVAAPLARVPLAGAQARTALHLDVPGLFKQRAGQCAHAHGAPRLCRGPTRPTPRK